MQRKTKNYKQLANLLTLRQDMINDQISLLQELNKNIENGILFDETRGDLIKEKEQIQKLIQDLGKSFELILNVSGWGINLRDVFNIKAKQGIFTLED